TKYADIKIKTPSISKNENAFHTFFLKYIKENQVDAVIPMFDNAAEYLSKYKNKLSKHIKFIIPDYEIFMRGYDKNQFMLFCQQNSLSHPSTLFDLTTDIACEAQRITRFPAIINPNITNGARGFKVVNNTEEIIQSV